MGAEDYSRLEEIGRGTFGVVYKCRNKYTGEIIAIKKMKIQADLMEKEGVPKTTLREIKYLQEIDHENIISLVDVCFITLSL
jgi:cyclin-dependent kinase 2